jgi:hypothetical protein
VSLEFISIAMDFYYCNETNCARIESLNQTSLSCSAAFSFSVMKYSIVLVLLLLLCLVQLVELKGRGGGGGGFKFMSFKKSPSRAAKTKQQKSASRGAAARASESDIKNSYEPHKDYGMTFKSGLSRNSYIYNDYYRTNSNGRGMLQFLTNAFFLRKSLQLASEASQYNDWDDSDDHFWRLTTKAPYFENKIPGE